MVPGSKCPFIGQQAVVIFLPVVVVMATEKPVKTPLILTLSANNSKKRTTCHGIFLVKFFFNESVS